MNAYTISLLAIGAVALFFLIVGLTTFLDRRKSVLYPIRLLLLASEVAALTACKVVLPRTTTKTKASHLHELRVTRDELDELHRLVYSLAQERIGRAAVRARRGTGGVLSGMTAALGTLAGYLTDCKRALEAQEAFTDAAPLDRAPALPHTSVS